MRTSFSARCVVFLAAISLALGSALCPPAYAASDLTGVWAANDGAVYYVRQIGNTVWWAGFDPDAFSPVAAKSNSFQRGITSAQVFYGTISGNTVTGDWAEMPRQSSPNLRQGTLSLSLVLDSQGNVVRLQTQSQTGGLAETVWTRSTIPTLPCTKTGGARDPYCLLGKVLKNQTETIWGSHQSLLDNLKPYKDNAVVFGTVEDPFYIQISGGSGLNCQDFFMYKASDDDLNFNVMVDSANLNSQPGFWTSGWINPASVVQYKLNFWDNSLHCESIMYGRQNTACAAGDAVFLPGWAESGANSTLMNGIPIGAGVNTSSSFVVIPGRSPQMNSGSRVRIIGPIILDCGHGATSPCYEDDSDNDRSNPDSSNLEIHPVYSVDVLQDYDAPRAAGIDLTGDWADTDAGTYYVRQIGNTVWWLGLSSDQGLTFANVFHGTLGSGVVVAHPVAAQPGETAMMAARPSPSAPAPSSAATTSAAMAHAATTQPSAAAPSAATPRPPAAATPSAATRGAVAASHATQAITAPGFFPVLTGQWASLPLGSTQGNGDLTLGGTFCKKLYDNTVPCDPSQPSADWNLLVMQTSSSPVFANPPNDRFQWQKLFDEQTVSLPHYSGPAIAPLGPVANGLEAKGTIRISNTGTAPLTVQVVSSNMAALKFSSTPLTVAPLGTGSISVSWLVSTATTSGKHYFDGVLSLTTNDPTAPSASISVQLTVNGGPPR